MRIHWDHSPVENHWTSVYGFYLISDQFYQFVNILNETFVKLKDWVVVNSLLLACLDMLFIKQTKQALQINNKS